MYQYPYSELLCLRKAPGDAAQRIETYMQYGEGAAQAATPRFAKSTSRVVSFAGKQAVRRRSSDVSD